MTKTINLYSEFDGLKFATEPGAPIIWIRTYRRTGVTISLDLTQKEARDELRLALDEADAIADKE